MAREAPSNLPPTKRPGGRAATVVASVHRAAAELLAEVGYDAMTLPNVAERAGVNKTTVYRRWTTKASLVSELLLDLTEHRSPTEQGDLVLDLVAMLDDIARTLNTPLAQALLRASLDGQIDPLVRRDFWNERTRRSANIVERAIQRGDLPPKTDPKLLLEHAASTVYFRMITGDPVAPDDLHTFAKRAIATARMG